MVEIYRKLIIFQKHKMILIKPEEALEPNRVLQEWNGLMLKIKLILHNVLIVLPEDYNRVV